uniref:Crystallin, gamma M5 n=1 Tax=Myripristis murdjan TaxID=586833 RepID=A0A667ZFB3_9TELE
TSSDCPELTSYLSRCNSCRVESGCFMVYERPNFMGHQMLVRRGEYPDNQRLMGVNMSDCIRSCRMIPMHRGQFRMRIYERENFGGQMYELMDDCDSIQDRYRMSDCQSCNVIDGVWSELNTAISSSVSHNQKQARFHTPPKYVATYKAQKLRK